MKDLWSCQPVGCQVPPEHLQHAPGMECRHHILPASTNLLHCLPSACFCCQGRVSPTRQPWCRSHHSLSARPPIHLRHPVDTQLIGRRLSPIRAPPPGSHLGWPHSASLGATNECPSSGTPSGLETMSLTADDLASGASRPTPGARAGAWGEACAPAAYEAREGTGAAPCQGRPARLPILNKAGRLVGYRQNSQCMAGARPGPAAPGRPTSAPSTPSSASCSGSFSEAGSGLPAAAGPGSARLAATAGCAVPTPAWAGPVPAEFEAAAADPLLGFPDAANLLPGYVLGPVAGKGGFCTVRRALHAATGAQVAVKIIEKARLRDATDRERVEREVRVMRALNNHVNIVRVLESAETADAVYVVMEHCTGGWAEHCLAFPRPGF